MAPSFDFATAINLPLWQKIASENLPQFGKALTATLNDVGKAVKELAGASVTGGTSFGASAANVLGIVAPIVSAALPFIMKSPLLAAGGAALAAGTGAGTVAAGAGAAGGIGAKLLGGAKFLGGGLLKGGIGGIVGMGGEMLGDSLKDSGHEKLGAGASILGKTAGYAAMGSMLGPLGTLAGGALGAGMGLYENWGNLFGKTKTPVTDAKGTLTEGKGGDTASTSTTTTVGSVAADPQKVQMDILDKMTELVNQNKMLVKAQTNIHDLMRDSKDIAQKHLRVVS